MNSDALSFHTIEPLQRVVLVKKATQARPGRTGVREGGSKATCTLSAPMPVNIDVYAASCRSVE